MTKKQNPQWGDKVRHEMLKGTGKPFFDLFDLMNKQVWHLQLILPLFVVDWGCPEIL